MLFSPAGRLASLVTASSKRVMKTLPSVRRLHFISQHELPIVEKNWMLLGIRFHSTLAKNTIQPRQMKKEGNRNGIDEEYLGLTSKPDFSPIPVLTKKEIAKITTTEVGSENLNMTERDIVEIDSVAKQLYDLLNSPFLEETLLDLKDMNVDKTFNKIKDTLHVDNLPKAIKAIRVLSAQNRLDDALLLWNIIKQDPKQCTLFAWAAYLNTLCTHGRTRLAQKEVKEMILQGITPNQHIYGMIVHGLVREGHLDEAYTVTREMTENGVRPNNVIFSCLINGCIKSHQLLRASETFDLMRNYVEEADSISTALMIKVSEMAKNTEKAIQFFNSIELHNQPMTQGCYHAIMHACAVSWRYDVKAFDYFEKMVNAGLKPTLASYHILLEACTKHGDFVRVNDVFRQIHDSGLEPTAVTYSYALRALAEGCGRDLAMPEHPAGDRRLTRKEYERILRGYEKPEERDRYSYIRDLRKKDMDDGLGDLHEENPKPAEKPINPLKVLKDAEERLNRDTPEEVLSSLKVETNSVPRQTRTDGLSDEDFDDVIREVEGIKEQGSHSEPTLKERIEEIVRSEYLLGPQLSGQLGDDNRGGAQLEGSNLRGTPGLSIGKGSHNENYLLTLKNDLMQVEKKGRSLIQEEYVKKGGDLSNINYQAPEWTSAVEKVLNQNVKKLVKPNH